MASLHNTRIAVSAIITGVLAAAAAFAAPPAAPNVADAQIIVVPHPYDEDADAHAQVAAALAAAKLNGKRVLIDFGGNWCLDCKVLAGLMEIEQVKHFMREHYEVVSVDVGRYKKNMDIAADHGITIKGAPTVLVLNADGSLVNATNSQDLTDARHMNPQGIADYLAQWAPAKPGS
jgi:thiol:disulfide interchange protein